jgi:hypothetical protein
MNISPEEAAQALQEIEASRAAMRQAVRAHRGHYFLWIWGAVWSAVSVVSWMGSTSAWTANLISLAGAALTVVTGFLQGRQIRSRIDKRFIAVCLTLLLFGYGVWPVLFGGFHSYKEAFGFSTLLWMQVYIVGGIWFDNYWLWVGIATTVLILAGFTFFPALFWPLTLLAGLMMIASGFYVRYFWR